MRTVRLTPYNAAARLDGDDLARIMTTYRGQPDARTPPMRYKRNPDIGKETAYVFDEETGMVYILD